MGVLRKPGRDQFDATRKLDAEVRNRFRPEAAGPDSQIQNVPAAAAVLVDEVKVVPAVEIAPPHRFHMERAQHALLDHWRIVSRRMRQWRSIRSITSSNPSPAPR